MKIFFIKIVQFNNYSICLNYFLLYFLFNTLEYSISINSQGMCTISDFENITPNLQLD